MGINQDIKDFITKKAKIDDIVKKQGIDDGLLENPINDLTPDVRFELDGYCIGQGRGAREEWPFEGYVWKRGVKLVIEGGVGYMEAGSGVDFHGICTNIDSRHKRCIVSPATEQYLGDLVCKKGDANTIKVNDKLQFDADGAVEKVQQNGKPNVSMTALSTAVKKSEDTYLIKVAYYGLKAIKP